MANQVLRPENRSGADEIDVKQKSLFARLKRLFATGNIVRNVGGKKIKLKDTGDLMYATDRNSLRDRYNRVRSTSYNAYSRDFSLSYQAARIDLFRDYDTMDMDPIITSALDIYADECLTKNELGNMLVVHSDDNNVKEILTNLYYDILNIDHNLWSWTRNLCKYGDHYMRVYLSPEYGVYQMEPISAYNVERLENTDPLNKNYVKFQIRPTDTSQVETLEKFECVHFRLLSDSNFLPYGKSMIEGARRVWKQLSLMEDAMLIHRIMRAPEKRIFKIDIGNIPPAEVDTWMEKMMAKIQKAPFVDPNTGEYNLKFNLINMVQDFWLPVRGTDSGTAIETLSGMEFTGIDDIEYLRNKLMAALKIPKAFLGYEEELSGKATLASEDVRFARTIQRIQKVIISGLEEVGISHLYAQGYRDESLVQFKLELTNPSTIFEKEKITLWGEKVAVAKEMMAEGVKLFSKAWIYKNVFNLSTDDSKELLDQIVEDSKQLWRLKSIEEEGNDPAKPFQKINPKAEEGGGGPGGPGGPPGGPEGGPGGGPEAELAAALGGPEGGGPGGPGGGPPGGPLQEVIKKASQNHARWAQMEGESVDEAHGEHSEEYNKNRDQSGEHDAHEQHPFGEDPLGQLRSVSDKERNSPLAGKFKGDSPLSRESIRKEQMRNNKMLTGLQAYLDTHKTEKKELIKESQEDGRKSMLDEGNILE
jgi:hypothetical protein